MKFRFTTVLIALVLSLQAQIEPFDQFFYKTLWDKLPQYDSITVWYDSISPEGLYGGYSLCLSSTGMIDTMHFEEFATGENIYLYSGKRIGNTHVVVSYYKTNAGIEPYNRTSFVYNPQGQVKEVYQAYYDGMIFEEVSKLEIDYLPNQKVDALHLSGLNGTTYVPIGDYQYYYSNNNLDSVLTSYHFSGRVVEKYQPVYDPNGRMRGMDFYEYTGFSSGLDLTVKNGFIYNGAVIAYVQRSVFDFNDSTYKMVEAFEYSKKKTSNLALPVHPISELMVYPNPTTDFVKAEGDDLVHYRLFDINGRFISEGDPDEKIDLSLQQKGYYLLHLTDKNGSTAVEKIVKR